MKGIVISGEFGNILVRQKSNERLELGELLVADLNKGSKILLQVFDLIYGSQLSQQNLELISGLKLEEDDSLELMDSKLRVYVLAKLKNVVLIENGSARTCKTLPAFFSQVRKVKSEDLSFLTKPKNPLFVGWLRSGSNVLNDVKIYLDGEKVFSHHILIPATTGKGKSNLTYCMLWDSIDKDYCGVLVLDPHDEYYGRVGQGLKEHKMSKERVKYYTPKKPPVGASSLKINLSLLLPAHFNGVVNWSDPQYEAINTYYKEYRDSWIDAIVSEKNLSDPKLFHEGTLAVVKRKMMNLLSLGYNYESETLVCKGVFDTIAGKNTLGDIVSALEGKNVVIVDTSDFSGSVEILIGSMISTKLLQRYKYYKTTGELARKPVISIVIEEAPRVLGKEVLEKGPNIFATIAREGRKFKVGLCAITQLPSLIPRQILANMNTKIILGTEMKPERHAIIESAAQDLSTDERAIASLDRGEAIISSNFLKFAIPIKIPLFSDLVKAHKIKNISQKKLDFSGVKLA